MRKYNFRLLLGVFIWSRLSGTRRVFLPPSRETRIRSDWTFFHLVLSATLDQKKLKILQLFIIRVADHRPKPKQKIGTKSPFAWLQFCSDPVPIPCLFSWLEIGIKRDGMSKWTKTLPAWNQLSGWRHILWKIKKLHPQILWPGNEIFFIEKFSWRKNMVIRCRNSNYICLLPTFENTLVDAGGTLNKFPHIVIPFLQSNWLQKKYEWHLSLILAFSYWFSE